MTSRQFSVFFFHQTELPLSQSYQMIDTDFVIGETDTVLDWNFQIIIIILWIKTRRLGVPFITAKTEPNPI